MKPIRNDMRWVGRCQYHEGEGWVQLAWWPDLLPSLVGLKLAKVGTNLNQVAKAFNTLVKMRGEGGGEKLPEVGKKIASLRREITEHTGKVLRVLEAGTTVWEAKGRGQRQRKRK
ncbi:plasmid mobilization relaxosome protein MobC [Verminephrobacter eiseniae]|uniref:plasmid mobilization relaxosome protein MobC n=1 Tax=Verminephrobacter eiseniae TaxID=364317 RepID=UPI002237EC9A|nr:plasmid mobilization relaxosome protein MobC [Verminephrobacter eiseniae]